MIVLALGACSADGEQAVPRTPAPTPKANPRILLFTRTKGFVHRSIPAATAALKAALASRGAVVDATGDPVRFTRAGLASFDAVVFLLTTGDVLDDAQQQAFEAFVGEGHGYAGVHSASDTEYEWSWYQDLVGATFKRHPKPQRATMTVVDTKHRSTEKLPNRWVRTEEWYDFRAPLPATVRTLVTVDESTYTGATMGNLHPVSWCRGNAWYTAMGHAGEAWKEPDFVAHVAGGVLSVVQPGGCP